MQFFSDTHIDFLSSRKYFFYASTAVIIIGLLASFIMGPKLGIDFTGGTEIAYKFDKTVQTEDIRTAVTKAGLTGSEIKSFGKDNQYLIRVKESENAPERVEEALQGAFPDVTLITLKVDKIQPKIGAEIGLQALIAIILAVFAILIYIGFRFEFTFGLAAIVALVHDVLISFGLVVIVSHLNIINLEMNQSFVAAMLTVVGYSINDSVIIFDRIRENKEKSKGIDFIKMANTSINETLSRTVITLLTTVLVLVTLLLFGGPVLEGFAFTMLIGFITGTYSSIYIATPFVVWYLQKVKKMDLKEIKDMEAIHV